MPCIMTFALPHPWDLPPWHCWLINKYGVIDTLPPPPGLFLPTLEVCHYALAPSCQQDPEIVLEYLNIHLMHLNQQLYYNNYVH